MPYGWFSLVWRRSFRTTSRWASSFSCVTSGPRSRCRSASSQSRSDSAVGGATSKNSVRSAFVSALFHPPAPSIQVSNILAGARWVPMNIRCSKRWAKPVWCAASMRDPTLYVTSTATMGREWSSWRMTVMPLCSFELVNGMDTSSACATGAPNAVQASAAAPSVRTRDVRGAELLGLMGAHLTPDTESTQVRGPQRRGRSVASVEPSPSPMLDAASPHPPSPIGARSRS